MHWVKEFSYMLYDYIKNETNVPIELCYIVYHADDTYPIISIGGEYIQKNKNNSYFLESVITPFYEFFSDYNIKFIHTEMVWVIYLIESKVKNELRKNKLQTIYRKYNENLL